jgi:DNA transposase THAP9
MNKVCVFQRDSGWKCRASYRVKPFEGQGLQRFGAGHHCVEAARNQGKEIICALMFDEMAIKKHIEWDGKKFLGYVDVWFSVDDDSTPVATEALVLTLVCLNGYFLTGDERANIINQCLLKLHDVRVYVTSVTCDGPSCNFS